jgi:putative CocE/NonD family hydrolase
MVTARDGTPLATDAYIPTDRLAPGPTLVKRTPYDRRSIENLHLASAFVARGYNVVLQDTRGRGDSGGLFQHYTATPHEGEDGYDLLDWVCAQDWSDGKVGTTGFSYTGANQQALAIMGHPALKSQVIHDAAINYFRRTVREDGAFVIGQLATYALRMALTSPEARRDPLVRARIEDAVRHAPAWFARAPWREGDTPVSAIPSYERWLLFAQDNPAENETWRNPAMNLEAHIGKYPDIPVLMVTSWYGHHAWSTFRKLEAFDHHKSPTRVIIGTWIHTSPYGEAQHAGQTAFGPAATLDMNDIRLRWFDATLRGKDPDELAASPRITYFAMGGGSGRRDPSGRIEHGGTWAYTDAWPPAGGQDLLFHLESSGRLHESPPPAQARRRIDVNLETPVPTIGSSINNPDIIPGFLSSGGSDQVERADVHLSPGTGLPLSSRHDVAVFRSEPLREAVEITGPITLRLWLSADTPACDLSVKIVDEYPPSGDWPNGFAVNIAEQHQRFASWTSLLADDEAVPTEVEVGPLHLSNRFEVGHRIRLQIANSNWPRYDINPESPRRFRFSIWCGGATPSSISGTGTLRRPAASQG